MQIEFVKAAVNARKHVVRFDVVMRVEGARTAKATEMKDEYDFSSAERGRFCRPGAKLVPPGIVLDALVAQAEARDVSLDELINELL